MRLAVASGKGGAGKTLVAANLARVAADKNMDAWYLDCDVEEPNGAIFLKPEITQAFPAEVLIPRVDEAACTACGECAEICQYKAIVDLAGKVLVFPEMCHGCGGCRLLCPTGAITEVRHSRGKVEIGRSNHLQFGQGLLNIGEAMSPPVIRRVKQAAPEAELVVLDCPPGAACPAAEAVRGADYVLLVAEATPFGLHDLGLAAALVRALALPFGVVLNRANELAATARRFCLDQGMEIVGEIPEDRELARAGSRGELACEISPAYRAKFEDLLTSVLGKAGRAR